MIRDLGVRHIHFEDDNLTLRPDRFLSILRRARDEGLRFTWDTPNGVRADTLDEAALREFARSACVYLWVGVESGAQHVLDHIIGKRLDLRKVRRFAMLARNAKNL
jgi:magnesium-protoporphyrin IX monomethyl ester (oxidative) cyclase